MSRREIGRWLRLAGQAVRGSEREPTQGPVGEAIVLLAVPMVLEMVMESVFAVVDIFFVSRLGAHAVAGVALTEAVLTLIYTLAMGISIGATAIVSPRTTPVTRRIPRSIGPSTGSSQVGCPVNTRSPRELRGVTMNCTNCVLSGRPNHRHLQHQPVFKRREIHLR